MQVEGDKDKNEQEKADFFSQKNKNKNVLQDWVSCQLAADIKPNLISLDGTGR